MLSDDHRKNECTEQMQCDPGFQISAPSTTAAQSCSPCENNTFVDATNHREERCTPHATCGPGEYSSAHDPTRQRECKPCGLHTYQNLTSHRVEACKVQPVCEPGEYYALLPLASKAAKAECRPCTNGTYQDEQQHRNDKCEEQIKCNQGLVLNYTGSITEASRCIAATLPSLDPGLGGASTTIAIAAAVAVFVILALVIVVIRKRSGENEKKLRFDFEEKLIEFQLQQQAVRNERSQNEVEQEGEGAPPLVPCRIQDFEVDRAKLTRVDRLGHGNFGEVWKCYLDGKTLPVAAKVVRIDERNVNAEDREAHLQEETANLGREAVVMMGLGSNHPHVVSLVGVITTTGDLTVILALEANGDLKQFLETNVKGGTPVLLEEKRRWAHEIADGMKHVSGLHIVHRDVAARNIMVSESRICKIADFGLARAMKKKEELVTDGEKEEADYERYYRSEAAAVPVRWTAPEGLFTCRFSVASDVWSYAIVIVEIWQNGSKPYPQLSNAGLMRQLRDDSTFVHPKPADDCSEELYSLLKACWSLDPKQRPSFPQILKRLEEMHGQLKRSSLAGQHALPSDAHAVTIDEDSAGYLKPGAPPLSNELGNGAPTTVTNVVVAGALQTSPQSHYLPALNSGLPSAALTTGVSSPLQACAGENLVVEEASAILADELEQPSEAVAAVASAMLTFDEQPISRGFSSESFGSMIAARSSSVAMTTNPNHGLANSSKSSKSSQCTRPSPSGGACKNVAIRATLFCKGHTCPIQGCMSGKSTKMETCSEHVHVKRRGGAPRGTRARAADNNSNRPSNIRRKPSVYNGFQDASETDNGSGGVRASGVLHVSKGEAGRPLRTLSDGAGVDDAEGYEMPTGANIALMNAAVSGGGKATTTITSHSNIRRKPSVYNGFQDASETDNGSGGVRASGVLHVSKGEAGRQLRTLSDGFDPDMPRRQTSDV